MHAHNRAPAVLSYHQHRLIVVSTVFPSFLRLLMMARTIIIPVLLKFDSSWHTSTRWNLFKNLVILPNNLLALCCTPARLITHVSAITLPPPRKAYEPHYSTCLIKMAPVQFEICPRSTIQKSPQDRTNGINAYSTSGV